MAEPRLTLYGADWCPDCRRTKMFLGEHRVHYRWVDITDQEEATEFVEQANDGKRRIPTLEFTDGSVLSVPSNAELAQKLGLATEPECAYYDVVVVGAGPAGLTAALYLAREGEEVLVVEKGGIGGQAGITDQLENFPGFPEGIRGEQFADRLVRQAEKFGAEVLRAQEVVGVRREVESLCVRLADDSEIGARAVVVASGASYRRLDVPGESDLLGAGVHFCATCDGAFYKGDPVAVVGGGASAAEESLFLTRFADRVTLLVRGDHLEASPLMIEKIEEEPKIEVLFNTVVEELKGSPKLEEIVVRQDGEIRTLQPKGLFVFIGLSPNTDFLPEDVERDDGGFLVTASNLVTSMSGLFAAGDVRAGATHQAASAAGEGATVALMVRDYLKTV